jgi:hypothetical protein
MPRGIGWDLASGAQERPSEVLAHLARDDVGAGFA